MSSRPSIRKFYFSHCPWILVLWQSCKRLNMEHRMFCVWFKAKFIPRPLSPPYSSSAIYDADSWMVVDSAVRCPSPITTEWATESWETLRTGYLRQIRDWRRAVCFPPQVKHLLATSCVEGSRRLWQDNCPPSGAVWPPYRRRNSVGDGPNGRGLGCKGGFILQKLHSLNVSKPEKRHVFEHSCALCTVGSYASHSVCLSSVQTWPKKSD